MNAAADALSVTENAYYGYRRYYRPWRPYYRPYYGYYRPWPYFRAHFGPRYYGGYGYRPYYGGWRGGYGGFYRARWY
jgi:hypothetical protein